MADEPAIELPAPTAWPLILAFGVTLTAAGLVTTLAVSLVGLVSTVIATVGWFREVLPREATELVRVTAPAPPIATARRQVARVRLAPELQRAQLPLEIYPVSAGVKGGLAGSVAMAGLAMIYGLSSGTSVWYPINLLAAGFIPNAVHTTTTSELSAFHLRLLLIAIPIHLITSLLVGLLYGAMLPVMPRRPILLGGAIAPLFWSGLLYGILNIINPVLYQRIDWLWFVLSQVAFGLVAGVIVSRQERVRTWQTAPLAVRIGMEMPGLLSVDEQKGPP
ncbi:MAG: hypothetical protein JWL71_4820 [Acidobacteria bacterium]|nr:hypothetical protein [Acidobacteriota bacterium]